VDPDETRTLPELSPDASPEANAIEPDDGELAETTDTPPLNESTLAPLVS
jgi:hypothetical protein